MANSDRIRQLSDNVINQIAAGEVIERPASIVKELIENSLDAGAVRINVEIDGGGVDLIRIHDDGRGMACDQLHLALSRHCTSKLVEAVDLETVSSLGFRGEALSSIAAVARIVIISRTRDDAHGWQVEMPPGGAPSKPQPQAHPCGTTIEIRNLFATVPARRSFLKQARTEFLHILQFVRRAGFCYPEVALRLIHDGRQSLNLPPPHHASAGERRWRSLFGSEFFDNTTRVDVTMPEFGLCGWVGRHGYSRPNTDLQMIAINRRVVRDRNVAHAIRLAYDSAIEDGRYPAYAVHLDLPASALDVNVHPGKTEVRLREPRQVHDFVFAAVKNALADGALLEPEGVHYGRRSDSSAPQIAEPRSAHGGGRRRSIPRMEGASQPVTNERLLTLVGDRFALIESETGVMVMDLHRAIETLVRVRLERGECKSRPLIIPETIAAELTRERVHAFARLGLEFASLSENTLALRAVPIVVSDVSLAVLVKTLTASQADDAQLIETVAKAAALAFRAPPALSDRRAWLNKTSQQLNELGFHAASFAVVLGAAELRGFFD